MLTIRSRFRSSNSWSIGLPSRGPRDDPLAMQRLVDLEAAIEEAAQAGGDLSDEPGDRLLPVGLVVGDDLRRAGVVEPGFAQVMGVERLVADGRVGPVAPRAHQGGRDVPRTGPHGDPQG